IMRIVITGGGTGGHIYPALAIAQEIKRQVPDTEILYVGTENSMESKIVPNAGFPFKTVDITGIDRSSIIKSSQTLVKFPKSFFQSWDLLRKFKPDIVIGTGGYVSFPVVFAATFIPCRTIIHEQNAMPGLANRNLAKRVDYTLLTFAEARYHLDAKRIRTTGLPVRQEILTVDKENARKNLNFTKDKFTLVAFGGSRGAASINRAMLDVVDKYQNEPLQIIWITGEVNHEEIMEEINSRLELHEIKCHLQILPYMFNIEEALAVADLAVCRAGAGTISELAILGLPAILIPYPYAAESHQEKNARALLGKKAVEMVIDEFLDGDTLYKRIEILKNDRQRLRQMSINIKKEARPNALEDIVKIVLQSKN
ncbi:MAG TPA: undecaprenyldiphospho-muramoylpentapeptide beta-N-acetylglucosaminyltransferase, partial [Anaerovoracaceae bacterium]|nr:undecaprenyldiphospho-muramoylpentapeptide beta-N-acetylglucosaminyltransferase [Anaerovoracaceae bacterium]